MRGDASEMRLMLHRRRVAVRTRSLLTMMLQNSHSCKQISRRLCESSLPYQVSNLMLPVSTIHHMAYMFLVGLPRVVPKGNIRFGDISFPKGTVLSCNPYVLHTSKDLWGPDAAEYNPDRWFGPNAAKLERFFCPWGAGWASCPGQHIARIQMSKMAVSSALNAAEEY